MTYKMSTDRVKFTLAPRYYQSSSSSTSGMTKETCKHILQMAFGMSNNTCNVMMRSNPNGFKITCRPSQFARFIVFRHIHGDCINGVRDLAPELFEYKKPEPYKDMAQELSLDWFDLKAVLDEHGFKKVPDGPPLECSITEIDVSKTPRIA